MFLMHKLSKHSDVFGENFEEQEIIILDDAYLNINCLYNDLLHCGNLSSHNNQIYKK